MTCEGHSWAEQKGGEGGGEIKDERIKEKGRNEVKGKGKGERG